MARGSGKVEKTVEESSQGNRSGKSPANPTRREIIRREAQGIVLLALSLFVGLSVASLQFGAGRLMGPCGAFVGTCAWGLLGLGAYLAAFALGHAAVQQLRARPILLRSLKTAAVIFGFFFSAVLLHLVTGSYRLRGYSTGGLVGEYGAELMVALLGTAGTVLFGVTGLLLSALLTTNLTASGIGRVVARVGAGMWRLLRGAWRAMFSMRDHDGDEDAVPPPSSLLETRKTSGGRRDATQVVSADAILEERGILITDGGDKLRKRRKSDAASAEVAAQKEVVAPQHALAAMQQMAVDAPVATQQGADSTDPVVLPVVKKKSGKDASVPRPAEIAITEPTPAAQRNVMPIEGDADRTEAQLSESEIAADVVSLAAPVVTAAPAIFAPVRPKVVPLPPPMIETNRAKAPLDYIRLGDGEYHLPQINLLDFDETATGEIDRQAMLDLANRLEKTLADYGVKGRVSEIHPGPVVTMYEFVPQAGTKLSKITALSNDLAMALEALKVRIVAPIPGKAAVGIEVPNRVRETVFLKEIIGSESFARNKSKLSMALGKDIAGAPVCVDLAKMPHLLVAGTTGSGKSVSVNAMICSLLFNATPDEVKLIMIDPKMLELSIYEGIPHLLLPVVTDPKKANLALRWAVEEMERRYDLISKSGVRDIASYNKKLEKLLESGESEKKIMKAELDKPGMLLEAKKIRVLVKDENGEREIDVEASEEAVEAAGAIVSAEVLDDISQARAAMQKNAMDKQLAFDAALREEPPKKLPYIVIIIDEFADLMMVASKEVEMSVARIAQKARAAGIHLLLATQRPSVDVITGLIKANFPSRIAFQVASKIDARTILDQQGAESLLGMGDMLFTDRGLALKRVHGPLVTDGEIHRIVDFLKAQGKPVYDLDILKPRDEEGGEVPAEEDYSDEMYDQAVAVISEMRQASTSMLQRRLRLGYNRAARMIERMEREGIVGPADGAKPREVLVHSHAA